ncbi:DUF397 domain-containing protein [Streptomyces sp. NPDC001777]|uniref:DUF397 domain-containing protein n=1 Tax=Streptomyces sp. NPDC001777 TaxID=3364608 RepID=UPI003677F7D3
MSVDGVGTERSGDGGADEPGIEYSSSGDGNDCVEVATAPGAVRVRDSKDCRGPRLSFTAGAWEGFVSYVCGS